MPKIIRREHPHFSARERVARELYGVVITTGASHTRFPLWWKDLRKKRLQAWGGMLRFVDALILAGQPAETVLRIPDALRSYVEEELAARDGKSPGRAA